MSSYCALLKLQRNWGSCDLEATSVAENSGSRSDLILLLETPQGWHEVDLARPSQSGSQLHPQTRENE